MALLQNEEYVYLNKVAGRSEETCCTSSHTISSSHLMFNGLRSECSCADY